MVLIKAMNELHIFKSPELFPSPCGDYGSYPHPEPALSDKDDQEVSVPLRGLWFLSAAVYSHPTPDAGRFRPLAGIMVLIFGLPELEGTPKQVSFPSPCGDYGSYRIGASG